MNKNFHSFLSEVLPNFRNIPQVIVRRLVDLIYKFYHITAFIKYETKLPFVTLVTLVTRCYPLLPLLPLVNPCYPLLP